MLKLTSQFYFCPFFLSMDTYSGCTHNCQYCFAAWFNMTNGACASNKTDFRVAFPREVKELNREMNRKGPEAISLALDLDMPIHIGGMSDPFQPVERIYHNTKKALELIGNHPVIISTKNIIAADYFDLLKQNKKNVLQVSITTFDEKRAAILESGASTPQQRLELLRAAKKEGIRTVCRLQPYIPRIMNEEEQVAFANNLKGAADALTLEFLKLTTFQTQAVQNMFANLNKAAGYNTRTFYKTWGDKVTTDYELALRYKLEDIIRIRDAAHAAGLEFYSADNALRIMGDGPCCCGVPENWFDSKHKAFGNRLPFLAAQKEEPIVFDEFYADAPIMQAKLFEWTNPHDWGKGETAKNMTFLDGLRMAWQKQNDPNNPANFFANLRRGPKPMTIIHNKNWLKDNMPNSLSNF